jgi:ubiquinone/menaquinone biosynthesis C-methylase UbiE
LITHLDIGANVFPAMPKQLDYDNLAATYDLRYHRNAYTGVADVLGEFIGDGEGRVLEVGCGTGHWLRMLERGRGRVVGLDVSRPMLQQAREGAAGAFLCHGSAKELPYRDQTFDRVICINTLHHFGGPERVFSEVRRVLTPGGGLLVVSLDPHTGSDRWCIYEYFEGTRDADLTRYLSAARIRELMGTNGLSACRTREAAHFDLRFEAGEALARGWLAQSTTSQLAILSADEYERGIARIRAAERQDQRLELTVDVRLWATEGWWVE